jgi:ribosome-associated translation inhibitor RaiA
MSNNSDQTKLRVQFDSHQHRLTEQEKDKMLVGLESLGRQVEHFPIADLHVLIAGNGRSNDVSIKLTLILPGETLVGSDHDQVLHAAFERCLAGLEANVRAYKCRLDQQPERQKQEKGTHQNLEPDPPPDPAAIEAAVRADDYEAFRTATLGYEEALRKRAGRWIERYPDVQARIGKGLEVNDVVEGVFLRAFEGFARHPRDVRFGDWLASFLDPVVRALRDNAEEELENINLVRSARAAQGGPRAG